MGLLNFFTGAASAGALFHYTRNVRSAVPKARAAVSRGGSVDAQRFEVALSPPIAARCAALLGGASGADGDAARAQRARAVLARAFFASPAFTPERVALRVMGVDARRSTLEHLAWVPGDRFALWTVLPDDVDEDAAARHGGAAPADARARLTLAWAMPSRHSRSALGGTQVLDADVTDDVLGVTLTTGIRRGDGDALGRQQLRGRSADGPVAGFATAFDALTLALHTMYAKVLTRACAEALRRML